jgi:hypothetical protein
MCGIPEICDSTQKNHADSFLDAWQNRVLNALMEELSSHFALSTKHQFATKPKE